MDASSLSRGHREPGKVRDHKAGVRVERNPPWKSRLLRSLSQRPDKATPTQSKHLPGRTLHDIGKQLVSYCGFHWEKLCQPTSLKLLGTTGDSE